ncbi:hypothetical protein D3C81_2266460 [compost metagenome]
MGVELIAIATGELPGNYLVDQLGFVDEVVALGNLAALLVGDRQRVTEAAIADG